MKELLKHYTGDVAAGFAFLLLAFRPRTNNDTNPGPELPPAIGARMMEMALIDDADPKTMACMCRIAMQHALESRAALAAALGDEKTADAAVAAVQEVVAAVAVASDKPKIGLI